MLRRFLWGIAGLVWALGHGFLTLLVTGGGHGNFLWVSVFVFGYFFGLFIPVSAVIVSDPKPFWARVSGWCLVALTLALTIVSLVTFDEGMMGDVSRSWDRSPSLFVFMSVLHFVPVAVFAIRLATFRAIDDAGDELTQPENI